jgi:L-lactate dehydrogenase
MHVARVAVHHPVGQSAGGGRPGEVPGLMVGSTVSVIGAGHVGSAVANALVLLRACDRVVLFDRNLARAEGEAWDIADAIPQLAEMQIMPTADHDELAGSDAVVITVGATVAPGQSRLELLGTNAGIIAGVIDELDRVCPDAVVILVSNPVDVLTRIAIETSTRPDRQIIGAGTVLDGARLRHRLGMLLGIEEESVHVYVVGEHGDSSVPVWSSATVGAIRLQDYPLPNGASLSTLADELTTATRERGLQIVDRKGFTSYGVASAAARIVRAVVRDEKRIFMVSVKAEEHYGIGDVVLSLPSIVGRAGVDRQLLLSLSQDEQRKLQRSAAVLHAAYESLTATAHT